MVMSYFITQSALNVFTNSRYASGWLLDDQKRSLTQTDH